MIHEYCKINYWNPNLIHTSTCIVYLVRAIILMWICFVYYNWNKNTVKLYYGLNSAIVTAVAEYGYIIYIILFTTNNYIPITYIRIYIHRYLIYVLKFHTIVSVDNDRTVYILFYFISLLINIMILKKLLIKSQSWTRTKRKIHLSSSYRTLKKIKFTIYWNHFIRHELN